MLCKREMAWKPFQSDGIGGFPAAAHSLLSQRWEAGVKWCVATPEGRVASSKGAFGGRMPTSRCRCWPHGCLPPSSCGPTPKPATCTAFCSWSYGCAFGRSRQTHLHRHKNSNKLRKPARHSNRNSLALSVFEGENETEACSIGPGWPPMHNPSPAAIDAQAA